MFVCVKMFIYYISSSMSLLVFVSLFIYDFPSAFVCEIAPPCIKHY
jgi:hypothetical protein